MKTVTQGNFREIAKILDQANEFIDLSHQAVARHAEIGSKKPAPELRRFDANIIREAAAMTKDISSGEKDRMIERHRLYFAGAFAV